MHLSNTVYTELLAECKNYMYTVHSALKFWITNVNKYKLLASLHC